MDADYHSEELRAALDPSSSARVMPTVLSGDLRVLDVGCGAGQTLIASRLEPGCVAVGLDVDRNALMLGRSWNSNIQFVCGRAEHLPFTSNYFDLVIARVTLPYTRIPDALKEMHRVLRSGGRCWLVLHPISLTFRQLLRHATRLQARGTLFQLYALLNGVWFAVSGKVAAFPGLTPPRYESFQTTGAIRRQLERTSFTDITVVRDEHFVVTAHKPAVG